MGLAVERGAGCLYVHQTWKRLPKKAEEAGATEGDASMDTSDDTVNEWSVDAGYLLTAVTSHHGLLASFSRSLWRHVIAMSCHALWVSSRRSHDRPGANSFGGLRFETLLYYVCTYMWLAIFLYTCMWLAVSRKG